MWRSYPYLYCMFVTSFDYWEYGEWDVHSRVLSVVGLEHLEQRVEVRA